MKIEDKTNNYRIYLTILIASGTIHNLQQKYFHSDLNDASLLVKILLLINLIAFIFTAVKVIGSLIDLYIFNLNKMEIQKAIEAKSLEKNRLEQENIKEMVEEIISREDESDETA
jgi:cell division protein FtsL